MKMVTLGISVNDPKTDHRYWSFQENAIQCFRKPSLKLPQSFAEPVFHREPSSQKKQQKTGQEKNINIAADVKIVTAQYAYLLAFLFIHNGMTPQPYVY